MRISIIVAMDEQRLIGANNALPWKLPADLKYFKEITWGKPIIMGRLTFESIGRPLPGRSNIVITRDITRRLDGCTVANSLEAALAACGDAPEAMIVGGGSLYAQVLPRAQRMYLTLIHARFSGDAYFPAYDLAQWRELERRDCTAVDDNGFDYSFVTLERIEQPAGRPTS
ncbi:MAG: type 3 dihydrofolate reductase [Gammaproteobacteria bacterium]|nr:MAG: type 3 dihydrofolate reductase [Gammaproteobacteria bacterium]